MRIKIQQSVAGSPKAGNTASIPEVKEPSLVKPPPAMGNREAIFQEESETEVLLRAIEAGDLNDARRVLRLTKTYL